MRCTIFCPWFGQLPFYAGTFLRCCAASPDILWVIHSDQSAPIMLPANVHWYRIDDLVDRVRRVFPGVAVGLVYGHKLCDLKPFWHVMFAEAGLPVTEYRGWVDWDVVHNLSTLPWQYDAMRFTPNRMCSPLYIQKNVDLLVTFPLAPTAFMAASTTAWDETWYLPNVRAVVMQTGLTPELDDMYYAPYAVHLCRGKLDPHLYYSQLVTYAGLLVS